MLPLFRTYSEEAENGLRFYDRSDALAYKISRQKFRLQAQAASGTSF